MTARELPEPNNRCTWLLAQGIENVFHTDCGHAILPMTPYPTECRYCHRPIYAPEIKP